MSGTPVTGRIVRSSGGAPSIFGRQERFATVGSTNDVVRGWLAAGEPEVCVAIADRQSAGRGRAGRAWVAPEGAALLVSLGFRPTWLAPDRCWRLVAIAALAMAGAAEDVAGLPVRTIRLKWPNDLIVEDGGPVDPRPGIGRKLAGLLGETQGLGTPDPQATIGIGVNVAWPAPSFPPDLAPTMTSLDELSGRRTIERERLLEVFLARLEPAVVALRSGRFDADDWMDRQLTTGRTALVERPDGSAEIVQALGVDPASGALVAADTAGRRRLVFSGEIVRLRVPGPTAPAQV